jgi:hypothetical protein
VRDLAHRFIERIAPAIRITLRRPQVAACGLLTERLILIDPPMAHSDTDACRGRFLFRIEPPVSYVRLLHTPQVPPSFAQCLQYLQFLQAWHGSEPVQVAAGGLRVRIAKEAVRNREQSWAIAFILRPPRQSCKRSHGFRCPVVSILVVGAVV